MPEANRQAGQVRQDATRAGASPVGSGFARPAMAPSVANRHGLAYPAAKPFKE